MEVVGRTTNTRVRACTSRLIQLPVCLNVILELLILTQEKFNSLLEPLLSINGIILLVLKVRLLLLPFGSLFLKGEKLFSLFGLSEGALAIQLLQFLLVIVAFLIKLSLELGVSGISFGLDGINFLLESLLSL